MPKENYNYDMDITNNPYIDLLVQMVKIMGMNCIVKNENEALKYEDYRSRTESLRYLKYMNGLWDEKRDGDYNPDYYFEWNSYYRMLAGLPPAYTEEEEKAYIQAYTDKYGNTNNNIFDTERGVQVIPELIQRYYIPMNQYVDLISTNKNNDLSRMLLDIKDKYLHELTEVEINILNDNGIMDIIKDQYTDSQYRYIYHLRNRVDFYTSRNAENFSLLYLPEIQFDIIQQKFRRLFDRNRQYTMSSIYSEAYRFSSYHYDNFILILIIIQTMVDIISEVQEYIINKDVFDNRTIRYLFESYGIAYYKEIPTLYQIRIIKNVNLLLKYKSSHRNITDIIALFDTDLTVYTYYLMKIKDIPKDEFEFYEYEDVNPKYNTNQNYYIVSTKPTNNRYPVINVPINEEDNNFSNKYINQVIDSFCLFYQNFLDQYEWFGMSNITVDGIIVNKKGYISELKKYLLYRIYGTSNYGTASIIFTMRRIGYRTKENPDEKWSIDKPSPNLNIYWNKCFKYSLFILLGLYNEEYYFNDATEEELSKGFIDININNNDYINLDLFFLRPKFNTEFIDYTKYNSLAIFDNTQTFNQTLYYITPEEYSGRIKVFVTQYFSYFINSINKIFSDCNYFTGWIDSNYVLSQIKNGSELTINTMISTIGHPLIPIYNNYYIEKIITEDMIGHEYYTKNYDLCFLKVPILEPNAYKFIEDHSCRRSYDSITMNDPFWDGVSSFDLLTEEEKAKLHLSKKHDILNKEFTIERTKYIAVEAAIDVTKMSYQLSYFMNMLYDKHIDEELLTLKVNPKLSSEPVKLNDLMTFVIALNYLYNGIEPDNIAGDMEKNMMINGFNFDTDWNSIYNNLNEKLHIYNNYLNEIHDYVRPDNNKKQTGYGLEPMNKGWLTEIYKENDKMTKDFIGNPEQNWGAFLSGRYEPCKLNCSVVKDFGYDVKTEYDAEDCNKPTASDIYGYSLIWNNMKRHKVIDIFNDYNDYTYDRAINGVLYSYPTYLEKALFDSDYYEGSFFEKVEKYLGINDYGFRYHYIDITWNTPYEHNSLENNSHGNFMNTEILSTMIDESELNRFRKLKEIYYTNTNLYEHLTYMMRTAESKRMYDIYNTVFESFMETKMNHDYYNLRDTSGNLIYEDDNGVLYKLEYVNSDELLKDEYGNQIFVSVDDNTKLYHLYKDNNTGMYYYKCEDSSYDNNIYECVKDDLGNYRYDEFYQSYTPAEYIIKAEGITGEITAAYNEIYTYVDANGNIVLTNYDRITDTYIPIDPDIHLHPRVAETYYEFLQSRNLDLYEKLIDIRYNYKNLDEQRFRIGELCDYILSALNKYFDSSEWKYIFNLIPTANIDLIQRCALKMIMFFKSWKTQVLAPAVSYIIDDPYQNHIHILDDLYYNTEFGNLADKVVPKDYWKTLVSKHLRDKIDIGEKIETNEIYYEPYSVEYTFNEKMYGNNFDFMKMTSRKDIRDSISIGERVEFRVYTDDSSNIKCKYSKIISIPNNILVPKNGVCTWTVKHDLDYLYPIVNIYNNITKETVIAEVEAIDNDTINIYINSNEIIPSDSYTCTVLGFNDKRDNNYVQVYYTYSTLIQSKIATVTYPHNLNYEYPIVAILFNYNIPINSITIKDNDHLSFYFNTTISSTNDIHTTVIGKSNIKNSNVFVTSEVNGNTLISNNGICKWELDSRDTKNPVISVYDKITKKLVIPGINVTNNKVTISISSNKDIPANSYICTIVSY